MDNKTDLLYSILDQQSFERRNAPKPKTEGVKKMVDDLVEIEEEIKVEEDTSKDECKVAVKMAFLGAGQGGGNLADAFWGLGYRKVAVVNTTSRDMQRLSIPEKNRHVLRSEGGAGKDPSVGRRLVESEIENVYSLIRNAFKTDLEQILLCAGLGGGCVDATTKVFTKEYGITSLSSLYEQVRGESMIVHKDSGDVEVTLKDTVSVLSADTKTGRPEWKRITSVWKNSNKGMGVRVTTPLGSVLSSQQHPYFVWVPEEQRIMEIPASKIQEGMYLVRPRFDHYPKFDENQWLLGYFAGNGSIRAEKSYKSIRFSHEHEEVLKRVESIVRTIDSNSHCYLSKDPRQNSFELYVSSVKVFSLISESFEFAGGEKTERLILPISTQQNFGSALSFFVGLIDSDGHIKEGRKSVDLIMAQSKLLNDLALCLSVYGFDVSVNAKSSVRKGEVPLTRLYSGDLDSAYKAFFSMNLTHKKRDDFQKGSDASRRNLGFHLSASLLTQDEKNTLGREFFDWLNGDGIGKTKLERAAERLNKDILMRIVPVQSVSTEPAEYFDLSVEDTQAYFASTDGTGMVLVHNTGGGATLPLVKLCKDYLKSIGQTDVEKKVGVIVTLPTKDESAAVQKNALEVLLPLIEMAEKGELSPLVIVDNARVMQLYGKASVMDVWVKANKAIAGLFHYFNRLCAEDSTDVIVTCDPQDYKSVLRSGILAFGRTKLEKMEKPTDVADAVRENVKQGLLVEGLDISKATHGAGILLANEQNLAKIEQESLEMAFGSLNRLMHQGPETKLHRGVYKGNGDGIYLYTMLSNLGRPEMRIQEMKAKAGMK